MKKTIVISAVNIRKGGTLTILRQCLSCLSGLCHEYRIVALVHDRRLCEYEGIEYIEMPDTVKSWGRRLRAEYVTMKGISEKLAPVYLWFSLHDTTPVVNAERRAVYCHTSFPFLKTDWQDLRFDPKIVAFSLLTRFVYRVNVHANDHLVVQTSWFRDGLSKMLGFPASRIIVARPPSSASENRSESSFATTTKSFIYPATADCHKGFETLCAAAEILEKELGTDRFKVILTIKGDENKYAKWVKQKWGHVSSIDFHGFVSRAELDQLYGEASALAFPSRVETWGLPISEFAPTGKPMILPDLPYAHETAAGAPQVRFVVPRSAAALSDAMKAVLLGDLSSFNALPSAEPSDPVASDWAELFSLLLS